MQRLLSLVVITLAGCPAPARYIVADVTAARAPVPNALVATRCGAAPRNANARDSARRTDEEGRARLPVFHADRACSLIVAKPGYPTVETGLVNVCPTPGACAPARIDLAADELATPTTLAPRPRPSREDAVPTGRRPLEVAQ